VSGSAGGTALPRRGEEPIHPLPPTPQVAGRRRRVSNLTLRLLSAALLIPPVTWAIFQGGLYVPGFVLVIVVLGLREFYQLIEAKGAHPLEGFGIAAGAAVVVVTTVGSEYHATLLLSAVLLGTLVLQLQKARIADALESISGTFFGVFYVGWLLSHAIVLREFQAAVSNVLGPQAAVGMDPDVGAFYLFFAIAVVVAGDAGAYFAGRAYGRRKLAPRISPGKTVEGAAGAVLAGVAMALTCKAVFDQLFPALSAQLGFVACGIFGAVLAVTGIVGDLVESLLKRDAQVKDTAQLLPGMGGILDRIDSSLLAIPVMYYLLLATTFLITSVPQPGL
jgi:phosphatidate cytidylyltransferase